MTMQLEQFELPAHWACALMYGDESGLDQDDLEALDRFMVTGLAEHCSFHCVDVTDDQFFTKYHDATQYGVLACDCLVYTFDVTPQKEERSAA